ncbi:MAG: hypothetical protein NVSMB1_03760 [Polyangiales bacterium]
MGLSFGEILVLAILALVVIGPKDLPRLLRTAGRLIGQAKQAVADVRRETGLDDVLRGDFKDLERLADHIESLEPYKGDTPLLDAAHKAAEIAAFREREYPRYGADAHGLLPDDAHVYSDASDVSDAAAADAHHALDVQPGMLGSEHLEDRLEDRPTPIEPLTPPYVVAIAEAAAPDPARGPAAPTGAPPLTVPRPQRHSS